MATMTAAEAGPALDRSAAVSRFAGIRDFSADRAWRDRADRALLLFLDAAERRGVIEELPDGAYLVMSQSAQRQVIAYHVTHGAHGACSCPDWPRADGHWCKHRMAVCLWRAAHGQR